MSYIDITYVFVYWANKDACLLAHTSSLTKAVKPVTVIKTIDAADETTS